MQKGGFCMNKKIVIEKATLGLKELKKRSRKDNEVKSCLSAIELAFQKDPEEIEEIVIVKNYYDFALILDFIEKNYHLTKEEIGYLIEKVFRMSAELVYSTPYSLTDFSEYSNILTPFGINKDNFSEINEQFLKNKVIEIPNMIKIKNYIRRGFDLEKIFSVNPTIAKSLQEVLERLQMTNKNPIAIKKAIHNLEYIKRIENAFYHMLNLSKEETLTILTEYILDSNLKNYEQKRKKELEQTLWMINEQEENKRLELIDFYKKIKEFIEAESHTKEDYERITRVLLKEVPRGLISSFLWYTKEEERRKNKKEKIEVRKESQKSKKQWKRELQEFYNEKENLPFDYQNFAQIIEILSALNYADEIKIRIWNTLYVNAIKNKAYYEHVYDKNKYYEPEQPLVRELGSILEEIQTASKEDKEFWIEEINSICAKLQYYMTFDFGYEMGLIRKAKKR